MTYLAPGTSVSLSVKWDSDADTTPNREASKGMGRGVKSRKKLLLSGSQGALLPTRERRLLSYASNSPVWFVLLLCPFYR